MRMREHPKGSVRRDCDSTAALILSALGWAHGHVSDALLTVHGENSVPAAEGETTAVLKKA